jgi:plastocyanin
MRTNLAFFAVLALTGIACGDDSTSSSSTDLCAGSGAAATVTVADNYTYTPDTVTITVGQSVCWQNTGQLMHTVTEYLGRFNGSLPGGQTFVRTFTSSGSIPYSCQQHSNMSGTVIVNP